MIPRKMSDYLKMLFNKYPVITLTGPRQSGKTVLAKALFPEKPYANLEHPVTREYAETDPQGFLNQFPQGAIIDEIQRVPKLLSFIQVIVDENMKNGMFLLTGSQQFKLMEAIDQSLAGRTAVLRLLPFDLNEIGSYGTLSLDELLFSGFFPRLHDQKIPQSQFYSDYFETYLERDLRSISAIKDLARFQVFVRLCAGRIGQLLNLNSLANDAGISQPTARDWLSLLQASYIVFLLKPFHANIRKRLVKMPKLYFLDVGLAGWLCGIEDIRHVPSHPLRGNFFENLCIVEVLKHRFNQGKSDALYFYRDSTGNEVDLLYPAGASVIPIEFKSGQTISSDFTRSIDAFHQAMGLGEGGSIVAYAGKETQNRSGTIFVNYADLVGTINKILD